jgi:hypothetical protein
MSDAAADRGPAANLKQFERARNPMRALFGLVGLLVGVGVLVWWLGARGGGLDQTRQVLESGQTAREEVSQIGGLDPNTGRSAMASAELEEVSSSGKLSGLQVQKVEPDGAYAKYFGLQQGDTIVAVVYQGLRQSIRDIGDPEMAKAQISDAYSKQGQLVVKRGNAEITLPESGSAASKKQSPLDAIPGIR